MQLGPYGYADPGVEKEAFKYTHAQGILAYECLPTLVIALAADLCYKATKYSIFAVVFTSSAAACIVCLARKVFRDYTFFRKSEEIGHVLNRYPWIARIALIVATYTKQSYPVLSLGLCCYIGACVGLTMNIKWISSAMHWDN